MRLVRLTYADPAAPASLEAAPAPELPGPAWARVEVEACGVCGSDTQLFDLAKRPAPVLSAFVALPIEVGHEIVGTVKERGADCPFDVGERVAVDPTVACLARGIDPPCPMCTAGTPALCEHLASGRVTGGMGLGFTNGLGGGWGDAVVAHASMLHRIPEGVGFLDAVLHEPLSIAVRALATTPPRPGDDVVVLGAGSLGLAVIAAAKALFPASRVVAVGRYEHQRAAASALGADHVVPEGPDGAVRELAGVLGLDVVKTFGGPLAVRGTPYVVDAVGSGATITTALRVVDRAGTVVVAGGTGICDTDLTPLLFKEARVVGAFGHGVVALPGRPPAHSVDVALDLVASGRFPASVVVTHRFGLDEFEGAVRAATSAADGSRKVVLVPGSGAPT